MGSKYQTLHAHTTYSDGKMSHTEVLEKALEYGFSTLAFTDHDFLPDKKALSVLGQFRDSPVKWIIGTEISAGLPPECGGGQDSGLHIIGLFVDPYDKALLEHSKNAIEARLERMKHIVKGLQQHGFDITEKECLNASGGEVVGKPHIVAALKSKQKNIERLQDIVREVEVRSQTDSVIKEKYDSMIAGKEFQYPYALFLSSDAIFSEVYMEDKYTISLDNAVKTIRNAGGIALLAHYFSIKRKISHEILEKLLVEDRLDGVETVFGLWQYGTEKWNEIEKDREILTNMAEKHRKLTGGGVDLHYEDDFKKFTENTWYAERTVGMIEEIFSLKKIDTRWSSF